MSIVQKKFHILCHNKITVWTACFEYNTVVSIYDPYATVFMSKLLKLDSKCCLFFKQNGQTVSSCGISSL